MTNLDSILKSRDITLPTKVHLVKAMVFPVVMDVRVGLWGKPSTEKWMLLNYGIGEDSWESLGLQGDPTSPSWRRSALGIHWKDWYWSWNSNTLATLCKELTHWKRPWCWEGLGAGGEGHDRGWDGWMASSTRWTWIWVNSGSWWWTERGLACCDSWSHKESGTIEWLNWLTDLLMVWGSSPPGTEPRTTSVKVPSPIYWTTRKSSSHFITNVLFYPLTNKRLAAENKMENIILFFKKKINIFNPDVSQDLLVVWENA